MGAIVEHGRRAPRRVGERLGQCSPLLVCRGEGGIDGDPGTGAVGLWPQVGEHALLQAPCHALGKRVRIGWPVDPVAIEPHQHERMPRPISGRGSEDDDAGVEVHRNAQPGEGDRKVETRGVARVDEHLVGRAHELQRRVSDRRLVTVPDVQRADDLIDLFQALDAPPPAGPGEARTDQAEHRVRLDIVQQRWTGLDAKPRNPVVHTSMTPKTSSTGGGAPGTLMASMRTL